MSNEIQETLRMETPEPGRILLGPNSILRQRYRLDSEIGRGGMGIVYRATDLDLKRQVAVKLLPDRVSSPDARERFIREARAAAALNHPNIVAVHDVGEDQGVPFFVMELVEGGNLSVTTSNDFRRVVEIGSQICQALEHAHAHNIVHRDLKPDNVLLSGARESGSIKLADLGLALPVRDSRLSGVGAIVGTPAYMAPEQILGAKIDGRADLYALGVVLYEMTTGRLPFMGDDPLTIVSQHIHAPVVPPRALRSDIPRALEAVIIKLSQKIRLCDMPAHWIRRLRFVTLSKHPTSLPTNQLRRLRYSTRCHADASSGARMNWPKLASFGGELEKDAATVCF